MLRFARKVSETSGLPPGTLVYVGKERPTSQVKISLYQYSPETYKEQKECSLEELLNPSSSFPCNWGNVDGLHDIDLLLKIGGKFQIHPLLLEDILNTEQRPKLEIEGENIFVQLRMFRLNEEKEIVEEQVSLFFNKHILISFQEAPGDVFETIRKRIVEKTGQVRNMGMDYLAYALVDPIVDHYYVILEKISDDLEQMEEELIESPAAGTTENLQRYKRKLMRLKKYIWPVRELVSKMEKSEHSLIKKATRPYVRDLYEHTVQILESTETARDMISGLQDLYLSSLSAKTNSVMKTLTMVSTSFIPLTFLAGVYGMNFKHFPELKWAYSYPAFWGLCLFVGIFMYSYFKKKKWF